MEEISSTFASHISREVAHRALPHSGDCKPCELAVWRVQKQRGKGTGDHWASDLCGSIWGTHHIFKLARWVRFPSLWQNNCANQLIKGSYFLWLLVSESLVHSHLDLLLCVSGNKDICHRGSVLFTSGWGAKEREQVINTLIPLKGWTPRT